MKVILLRLAEAGYSNHLYRLTMPLLPSAQLFRAFVSPQLKVPLRCNRVATGRADNGVLDHRVVVVGRGWRTDRRDRNRGERQRLAWGWKCRFFLILMSGLPAEVHEWVCTPL